MPHGSADRRFFERGKTSFPPDFSYFVDHDRRFVSDPARDLHAGPGIDSNGRKFDFWLFAGTLLRLVLVPVFYQIYGIVLSWFEIPLFHNDDDEGEHRIAELPPAGPTNGAIKTRTPILEPLEV